MLVRKCINYKKTVLARFTKDATRNTRTKLENKFVVTKTTTTTKTTSHLQQQRNLHDLRAFIDE